jgi:dephospho-CoA kinase
MIIGITGGIGSGKSVIARQLRQMGYAVYDTDSEAKRLIVEDAHIREQITALFGPEAYKDGVYQTAFVAQQVFNANSQLPIANSPSPNPLLARLNAIVHPAVRADILRWAQTYTPPKDANPREATQPAHSAHNLPKATTPCFVECAILYQAGIDQLCDKVVAVTAPEDIRLKRVIARDHSDIDKVRARMRAQEADKDLQRANIVVNNDGKTPIPTLCNDIIHQLTK